MRIQNYDYSQNGAYFITICTKDKQKSFWKNVGTTCGRPQEYPQCLSNYGRIINNEISCINKIYTDIVTIDKFVVMPNHIHLIIVLDSYKGIDGQPKVVPTISRIIQQFKGSVKKQIGEPIWQSRFHDHIIRNESDYLKIWEYIDTNPLKWELDCYYTNT